MATRFTGARSLDDRRRRRIATQPIEREQVIEETNPENNFSDESSTTSASDFATVPTTPLGSIEFPVRKIISFKTWKIALVCIAVSGFSGLLFASADYFSQSASSSSVILEAMFLQPNGLAFRVFAGVLLIFCAQLSFVIGWARSQSQKDFHGSFRIWRWNSIWLFAIAIGVLIDFPPVFAEAMANWGGSFSRYPAEIFWLLPVSFAGSVLVWNLIGEMRESQFARLCFWGTLVGTVSILLIRYSALMQTTGISILFEHPEDVTLAISLGSVCLLFFSLLTHCRHVLYRSVDPPETTNSFVLKGVAFVGSLVLKILSLFQRSKEELSTDEKIAKKKITKEKIVKKKPAEKKNAAAQITEKVIAEKQPVSESAVKTVSVKKETITRIDNPLDPESLKGLSKKQRRKLRQEHRQKNRKNSQEIA